MLKSRLKTCRTGGKLFIETGNLNKHKIFHDEEKAQNLQDMWEIIYREFNRNKHQISNDKEKAQNLQDMWKIIHSNWDLEQTQDVT